ncbi:hypothetical protein AGMMS50239_06210 [Bacteroidia bacterium]|nr:hypothetical protein AGMMS50239_06210 [Bacteroidia bacterium]
MHNKEHDRMMTELSRLIGNQENLTQADLEKIVNQFNSGKTVPKAQLTPQQQAEDLVYEAYELFPDKVEEALKKIEKALKLNPDCIEAYECLANNAPDLEMHLGYLRKGIEAGMKIFGGKYLEKNRGHFWGLTETRPFMRCYNGKKGVAKNRWRIRMVDIRNKQDTDKEKMKLSDDMNGIIE